MNDEANESYEKGEAKGAAEAKSQCVFGGTRDMNSLQLRIARGSRRRATRTQRSPESKSP